MTEITLDATVENITPVTEFVDGVLEENCCPMKVVMQIDIMIDELFSNIAHYAYGDKVGEATVKVGVDGDSKSITLVFIDSGKPYNPLEKEDPDITLSAEERDIGGLGIFMVKKSADDMHYEYTNNNNILTVIKKY